MNILTGLVLSNVSLTDTKSIIIVLSIFSIILVFAVIFLSVTYVRIKKSYDKEVKKRVAFENFWWTLNYNLHGDPFQYPNINWDIMPSYKILYVKGLQSDFHNAYLKNFRWTPALIKDYLIASAKLFKMIGLFRTIKSECKKRNVSILVDELRNMVDLPYSVYFCSSDFSDLPSIDFSKILEKLPKYEREGQISEVKSLICDDSGYSVTDICKIGRLLEEYDLTFDDVGVTKGSALAQRLSMKNSIRKSEKSKEDSNNTDDSNKASTEKA